MYEKYAALRDKAGLSDYEVAKRTGIAPATISNWKTGNYKPKLEKLILIADLFGVTIEELI